MRINCCGLFSSKKTNLNSGQTLPPSTSLSRPSTSVNSDVLQHPIAQAQDSLNISQIASTGNINSQAPSDEGASLSRKQSQEFKSEDSVDISQLDSVYKQTGFSEEDRTKIKKLMEPYVYGKDLTRSLSEAKFHRYRDKIVLENFLNTDLQSPHRPIGVCQELANDFVTKLEKEFPKYHFFSVTGSSQKYFPLKNGTHVFILGWAKNNHKKMTQFLQGIKTPQPLPAEALLIDPSFKLVEASNSQNTRGYYIKSGSTPRYSNPLFFKKLTYLTIPPSTIFDLPLGRVTDLIPNVTPEFKDCLYGISFNRLGNTQPYTVSLALFNPNGSNKSPGQTEEFKRRFLDQAPALKKFLHKAEQELKLPQNNEAYFDRLRRAHPQIESVTFNPFSHRSSFHVDIKDDHRPVLQGTDKKTPLLEFDDYALLHNTTEYTGLRQSLNNSVQAKEHLRSIAKTMPVIPKPKVKPEERTRIDHAGVIQLLRAAGEGHGGILKALLDKGADVNQANVNGVTPLLLAAENGHDEIVKVLLDKGADVNRAVQNGDTPLYMAAQNGHDEIVKVLLDKGADVNRAAKNGTTPLFMAVLNGHGGIVQDLLKNGAEVNQATKNGDTPLIIVAENGHGGIAKALIQAGANVNQANVNGDTPLRQAAQEGHGGIVQDLLKNGAEVNRTAKNGITPLFMAAEEGHGGIVKALIQNGADPNQANANGVTPLLLAAENGYGEIVKALLDKGADVNRATKNGDTPLTEAVQNGHGGIVKALIQNGADPNQANEHGATPLHLAANREIVELLKQHGATE